MAAESVSDPGIVVMGPMASGKTTLAKKLAEALALTFVEGDDLHAPESVAKMRAGVALSDEDRWPWLARVGAALKDGGVAACSALGRRHRDALRAAAGRDVLFVFLDVLRAELERRVAARGGHFMPLSLLESQLSTLEPPQADERAITVQAEEAVEEVVARIRAEL